jgi:BlaI family transcriptional regulator, penicillinase repressor
MPKQQNDLPELSKAEYDILRILWKQGKQSVREVHEQIRDIQHWAYPTTKTMLDRLVSKGLVHRKKFHGLFLYSAALSRPVGLAKLIQFFANRVLEVDPSTVVSMFAHSDAITPEEMQELRQLIKDDIDEEE